MDEFEKQMNNYGARLREDRCPLSQQELDRAVRHATWQPKNENLPIQKPLKTKTRSRIYSPWTAAAAVLAVLIPLSIKHMSSDDIDKVSLNGQTALFACNRGCSLEGTIDMFNRLIQ